MSHIHWVVWGTGTPQNFVVYTDRKRLTVSVFICSRIQGELNHRIQGFKVNKKCVYYESIKRELKTRPIYECRCDERLKTKTEESMCLSYTGLIVELEHLKIKTTLIDEIFCECDG